MSGASNCLLNRSDNRSFGIWRSRTVSNTGDAMFRHSRGSLLTLGGLATDPSRQRHHRGSTRNQRQHRQVPRVESASQRGRSVEGRADSDCRELDQEQDLTRWTLAVHMGAGVASVALGDDKLLGEAF
jgi:hypothetical protein